MPAPHHSVFYRPVALPAAQPTCVKALKAQYNIVKTFILVMFTSLRCIICHFIVYVYTYIVYKGGSVHQAAKLVAALLRVAGVTAGLADSNGSLPPGL